MRPRLRITVSILTAMLLLLTTVGQTQARSSIQKRVQMPLSLPSPLYNKVTLGKPKWWTGTNGTKCNDTNYYADSLPQTHSAQLGTTTNYRGVKACGPMPINGAPEVGVQFYTTPTIAPTENEWDCTELVKRYLYQAFGAPDLSANGKDVVSAYTNPLNNDLFKSYSNNGTVNQMPVAGDVLSFAATSSNSAGHTAIVKAVNLDAFGNGTITIMDENNGNDPNGTGTLSVSTWVIGTQSGVGAVTGWLDTRTLVSSPNHTGGYSDLFQAVSAFSANNVWAVGYYQDGSGYHHSLIEHWNGAFWTEQTPNDLGVYGNSLYGVKAFSAKNIWAVGSYEDTNGSHAFIEHTTNGGSTWAQDKTYTGNARLRAIDGDPSSGDAWAVGSTSDSHPVTLHLSGGSWSLVSTSADPTSQTFLYSVSEDSSDHVWVVGDYYNAGGQTFTMYDNGTPSAPSWTTETSPNPGGGAILTAVSNLGSSGAWAVGYEGSNIGFLTHWNGSAWSSATTLSIGTSSDLWAVTALNSNNIWAVGYYYNSGLYPLVYHSGNGGSSWQQVTTDVSEGQSAIFNGIAIDKNTGNT